jgi:hypothetical protein
MAATANTMGPSEGIDSTCQKSNGPIRNHQQLPQQIQWAHSRALAAPAGEVMGPSETISSIILDYINWPTRNTCPFLLDWPMWVFPSLSVKWCMGFTDYYDKHLVHYVNLWLWIYPQLTMYQCISTMPSSSF